jgi:uncharacterized membrane protein HdeD (DUF308 family)
MRDWMARRDESTAWSIALSLLMIVAGFLAILKPPIAGLAVTAIVGWLLIFSGLFHLAYAWRATGARSVIWEVILGLAYGGIGVYLLGHPVIGLASLTFALGVWLFVEAILEFALGFRMRPLPGSGWLVFDGVITLLLAVMIWSTWPFSSDWAIGTLVGVSMLFSGFSRLMLSFGGGQAVHFHHAGHAGA